MYNTPATPVDGAAPGIAPHPRRCRLYALAGLAVALAACAEPASPTAPRTSPVTRTAFDLIRETGTPNDLTADAIDRLLPALEKDAAAPVGNALRSLDAKLRDASASLATKDRAAAVLQNVLAQFVDPARPDAADLDAMRLEADDIRAALK